MSQEAFDPTRVAHASAATASLDHDAARAAASTPEALALKVKLAAAYQVIADRGLDDGIAGHISVRVPGAPHAFWVNTLGLMFSETTPDNLSLIDQHGQILEGGPINLAGFLIHAAIHHARPDVLCAVHTHSPAGRAFSALSRPLSMTDQNTCAFHDDVALYRRYTGVVVDPDQAGEIAEAMGTHRALVLQNHGLITTAETVEQATIDMVDLEAACATNLEVLGSAQAYTTIGDAEALQARAVLAQPMRYQLQWLAMMRELRTRNAVVDGFLDA